MVKKFLKKRSKRQPAKMQYKVAKKVREHNRKLKKEAKKNPSKSKRMKKDPGIPNSLPFKNEILREIEERKRRAEDLKQHQKQERHELLMKKRGLSELTRIAEKKTKEFEKKKQTETIGEESKQKSNYREFKKVIDASDVILQVLDARDPMGSRCPQVEEAVMKSGASKRIVLVLNKIDLIPKQNALEWLKYLRTQLPTIAFKSSIQSQRKNLSRNSLSLEKCSEEQAKHSPSVGTSLLMKLLGNYCRSRDIKTRITVGVVGFPNVGKSSVINSLKRTRTCLVGSTPGITKAMQEVHLDKHIVLIDSPGVVLAKESDVSSVLKNAIKVENIEDPIAAVEELMKRCNNEQLKSFYRIQDEFKSVGEFVALVAKKQGRLKKGGIPNTDNAARTILNNWNDGKIKYFTKPPPVQDLAQHLDAKIVSEMSAEFKFDGETEKEEADTLNTLNVVHEENCVSAESRGLMDASEQPYEFDDTSDDDEMKDIQAPEEKIAELMAVDEKDGSAVSSSLYDRVPKRMDAKAKKLQTALQLDGNLKMNQEGKKNFKKMKKQRTRNEKVATTLSNTMNNALSIEDYDFTVDFN